MQSKLVSPHERELKRFNLKLRMESLEGVKGILQSILEDGGKQLEKIQQNNKAIQCCNKKDH